MFYFTRLLLPVVVFSNLAATSALEIQDLYRDLPERDITTLKAVTVRPGIQKREESFIPKQDHVHHYADHDSILSGANSRFATTSMKYKLPTITLEDIELHILEIQCSGTTIAVEFPNQQTLQSARKTWDSIPEFLVISSHPGCNEDGERASHLVSSIAYSEDIPIAIFSTRRVRWKDTYDLMTVSFGTSESKYKPDSLRIHDGLRKRLVIPTGVIYPTVPTSTIKKNSTFHDISHQVPPGQQIFTISHGNETLQESVTVSCKNCSIAGTIDIAEGVFIVNNTLPEGRAVNFLNHGYFLALANGLNAHVELDTTLSLSTGQSFDEVLATIGIPGFQIPGVAAIGPLFELHLTGSIQIVADLDFTYGFDLTVPDNSSVLVNIGNVTESTVNGFNDAQITAIPLTASSPDFSLNLGLGLVAEVLLGVDILDHDGSLTAGMFINMPQLSLSVSTVTGVNAQCEPVNGSSTIDGFLSTVFPNLTNIVPQADIGVGFQVGAKLDIPAANIDISIGDQHILAGTSFPLPTVCVMWDEAQNAFTSPTMTTSIAGPTSTTGGTDSSDGESGKAASSGMRQINNPFSDLSALWWTTGTFLCVFFVAASS